MCWRSETSFEGMWILNWKKWNDMYTVRSSKCSTELKEAKYDQNINFESLFVDLMIACISTFLFWNQSTRLYHKYFVSWHIVFTWFIHWINFENAFQIKVRHILFHSPNLSSLFLKMASQVSLISIIYRSGHTSCPPPLALVGVQLGASDQRE